MHEYKSPMSMLHQKSGQNETLTSQISFGHDRNTQDSSMRGGKKSFLSQNTRTVNAQKIGTPSGMAMMLANTSRLDVSFNAQQVCRPQTAAAKSKRQR